MLKVDKKVINNVQMLLLVTLINFLVERLYCFASGGKISRDILLLLTLNMLLPHHFPSVRVIQ